MSYTRNVSVVAEEEDDKSERVFLPSGHSFVTRGVPLVEKEKLETLLNASQNTNVDQLPRLVSI